ncbi:MATE family efflux transporter [Portibacter marinus]|uniref:MATE family efflux transporter n=1 Tax=Portibacter marinus TaxID=2898660 RepID=UPI001F4425DE|nr:MATE family efflux transporter [Portibacter marinus]
MEIIDGLLRTFVVRKNYQLGLRKVIRTIKSSIQVKDRDFTEGSINTAIIMLAIPMMLEQIMESIFAVVDIYFVSKISVNAIATVGLTETFMFIIYSLAIGLSAGTTALIARRTGEKNRKGASNVAVQSIILSSTIAIAVGLFGYIYAEEVLRLMGGDEVLIAEGVGYTRILLSFNIIIFLLYLLNAIFRGAGDAAIAMYSLIFANSINIILDPLLIFGYGPFPEMGINGAATATCIGRGFGVLMQLFILIRGSSAIKLIWHDIKLDINVIWELIKLSLGGIGQYIIATFSWIFLVRIVSEFGNTAVAGYTVAFRVIVFTILPSWGLANAVATLVGQNLGAGKPDRAEKSAWTASFYNAVFLVFVSIIFWIFAPEIIAFFTQEVEVIREGVRALRIITLGYIVFSYGMVLGNAFNGAGDTVTPTVTNFIAFWLIEIPLAYALAKTLGFGSQGVYASIAIAEAFLAVMLIFLFRRGKWKLKKI